MYDFELEIYAEKIFYFRGIYKNSEYAVNMHKNMDSLLDSGNQEVFSKSSTWATSGGKPVVYGTKRSSIGHNLISTKNQELADFYKDLIEIFHFAGNYYFDKMGMDYENGKYLTDPALFRYYNGGEMGPHVDDNNQPEIEPIATGLIYLNNDKTGGDLWFPEQDVTIKSEAGSLVIFPSVKPFYHASTKIIDGEKYHISSAWKRIRTEEEIKNWKQ
jgi:hypothetical protein